MSLFLCHEKRCCFISNTKYYRTPLAKRITIELSQEVFDFSLLNGISKIIDTRGLEAGSVLIVWILKTILHQRQMIFYF